VLGRTAGVLLVAFAALAVRVRHARDVPGDGVLTRLATDGSPRALAQVVDLLTGYAAMAGLSALVVLLLARRGRRREAVLCAVSVTGALLGTTLLKQLVGRPRPELLPPSVDVSVWSFPSGHAAATAAVLVSAVLVVRGTRALIPLAVAGALLGLVAGGAQLVLARHHPSDLVGGWLWAAAWTTAVWAACDRRTAR
jgi:undecaprenyl-diphosphatase